MCVALLPEIKKKEMRKLNLRLASIFPTTYLVLSIKPSLPTCSHIIDVSLFSEMGSGQKITKKWKLASAGTLLQGVSPFYE